MLLQVLQTGWFERLSGKVVPCRLASRGWLPALLASRQGTSPTGSGYKIYL